MFSCYIRVSGCGVNRILSGLRGIVNFLNRCIFLFACEGVVSFDGGFLSVGCFINFGFGLRFRVGYWVHCVNRCFTLALLGRYIRVGGCGVNRILSGLRGVIYLLDGCILLFASQGVVGLDGRFLSVSCFINFGLSLRFRVRYWVHCVDCCFTLALLGCYIRVSSCGINGILSGLRGVIYLLDGCILLFASEGVVSFDRGLLSFSCVLHRLLSCWLSIWCWVDICDGLDASVFLCANLGSSRRSINRVLGCLSGIIHLLNSRIFFFLS